VGHLPVGSGLSSNLLLALSLHADRLLELCNDGAQEACNRSSCLTLDFLTCVN
jgi:hypothetical protein